MSEFDQAMMAAGLNRNQRKFCKIPIKHNVRLLAPAGSGKTFSLLWRCKYITEEYKSKELGEPHFLIVTFTRAAKFEIEHRLKTKAEFSEINATVSTLNAWGWDLLKSKPGKELIVSNFARKNLITHDLLPVCQKYMPLSERMKSARGQALYAGSLIDIIDEYKSLGFTHLMKKSEYKAHIKNLKQIGLKGMLDDAQEELYRMMSPHVESVNEAAEIFWSFWKDAVKQLESINRYTMEDQKYWARIMLQERIDANKHYASVAPYTHILIDEFQDINPLDLELIKNIAKYHGKKGLINLSIVGDDDQAIFGWRGTTPKYILYPNEHFGADFDTCILETNYRSPEAIIKPAAKLISYNKERVEKNIKSVAKGKTTVKIISRKKDIASINAVVNTVHELIEKKGCRNVALIGRKQAALFPYQVIFSSENVKYHVAADLDIFEGEAMKSLQTILKIVYRAQRGDDDNPINDLLTVCDKVDRYQIQNIEKKRIKQYLFKRNIDTFAEALDALKSYPGDIKNQSPELLYIPIKNLFESKTVAAFMNVVVDQFKGFEKDYTKGDTDTHYKNPQFVRLAELAKKYDDDFLRFSKDIEKARRAGEYSRQRDNDESGDGFVENNEIKIHLVTATRSKGKEYDAVIVLDVQEGEWPSALSEDIEEERRLFYVAMTRARKYLYFMTSDEAQHSRFLVEAGII